MKRKHVFHCRCSMCQMGRWRAEYERQYPPRAKGILGTGFKRPGFFAWVREQREKGYVVSAY